MGSTLDSVAICVGYLASSAWARWPLSTSTPVAGSAMIKVAKPMVTIARRIQPHTARPVAVAAGLCRSTVSVKAAIHAT